MIVFSILVLVHYCQQHKRVKWDSAESLVSISVSNVEYRVPGYPGNWPLFQLLEYPGNWTEYRVFQKMSLSKNFWHFTFNISQQNNWKKINLHLVVLRTIDIILGPKGFFYKTNRPRWNITSFIANEENFWVVWEHKNAIIIKNNFDFTSV